MRVLVYGAGVLGSYMAHALIRAGNDVTMLARGKWYRELAENGLVIRHAVQLRTTRDRVKLIESLQSEDAYDIVFVVMQYTQLPQVLLSLAANRSRLFVLVGNNMEPAQMRDAIRNGDGGKTVLFGFQTTGGRREAGRVISIHAKAKMVVGTLAGEPFAPERQLLKKAFEGTKYSLAFRGDMEAYLLSHVAFVMPVAYVCYATDGNLRKADKKLLTQAMDATAEGYDVLIANGIPIAPAQDEDFVRNRRGAYYRFLYAAAKTFVGRLAASDHAMNAVGEMAALSDAFDRLKERAGIPTPSWNALEQHLNKILAGAKA